MGVRGFWVALVLVALGALAPACSGDSPKRPEREDTTEECNELVNDGREVRYEVVSGAAPTPSGGTITDGTYELTAVRLYDWTMLDPTAVLRGVITVTGDTMQQRLSRDDEETNYTSTFTLDGTVFTMTDTCPKPNVEELSASATPNDFALYFVDDSTLEIVFSKR